MARAYCPIRKSSRRLEVSQSEVGRLLENFPAEGARWSVVDGVFVMTPCSYWLGLWNYGFSFECGKGCTL
jgi:hypothetical protein